MENKQKTTKPPEQDDTKPDMAVADRFTWQPGEVEILGDYKGKAEPVSDDK